MKAEEFDVLVVGAGPAGSAVAARLARLGWSTALVDRSAFPRDKPCGEFLTSGACRSLEELGAWQAVLAAGAQPIDRIALHSAGTDAVHTGRVGWMLRRNTLDNCLVSLAQAEGALHLERCDLRAISLSPSGRLTATLADAGSGERMVRARIVVGADGATSRTARLLLPVRPIARLRRIALVTHWPGVPASRSLHMYGGGDIVCGSGSPGPIPEGGLNVTMVLPNAAAPDIGGDAPAFVRDTARARFPRLAASIDQSSGTPIARAIGCYGHVASPPFGDGVLLVGDAATFIDPFTGEGVYFALKGAEYAAETAHEALRYGRADRKALSGYHDRRSELRQRYLLCDVVQRVVRSPAAYEWFVRALARSTGGRDRLFSVLAGDAVPSDLILSPFLWDLAAPQAWRGQESPACAK